MRKGDVGNAKVNEGEERTCRSRCGKARPLVDFHRVAKGSERRSYRCRFCCAWDQRQTRLRKKAISKAVSKDNALHLRVATAVVADALRAVG